MRTAFRNLKRRDAAPGNLLERFRVWALKPPYRGVPWLVWLYAVLCCAVVTQGGVFTGHLTGFDDHVRMVQVLEWINGHGWYDRTIARVNAPDGFTTIWSRVVDIPIAAVVLLAQQFTAQRTAALVASVIVPLLELAVLFPVARYYARPLVGKKDAWLVILFLMFTTVMNYCGFSVSGFYTGEASHHPWYIILDLLLFGAAARMALGSPGESPALMMGGAIAGLLTVGIEGFPMIAGADIVLAIVAWHGNRGMVARRAMQAMIFGTLFSLLLLPLDQPFSHIFSVSFAEPSILGPILMGVAALFMAAESFILNWCGARKFLSFCLLLAMAMIFGGGLILLFPQMLNGPVAALSSAERAMVYKEHAEAWPLYKVAFNNLDFIALVMPSVIALTAGGIAMGNARTARRRALYISYFGFAAVAGGLAEYIARFYHHALTTACPWLLWVWQRIGAQFRRGWKRHLVMPASFIVLAPLWMLVIPTLENGGPVAEQIFLYPAKQQMFVDPCHVVEFGKYLNAHYGKDTKIDVPGADSSRLLYYSDLRVDFLNNYPSQDKFIDNQVFFGTQDLSVAKDIARRHGFDLVALCPAMIASSPLPPLNPGEEPMMMERLLNGYPPPWLRQLRTGLPGYLLFAVDKKSLMK